MPIATSTAPSPSTSASAVVVAHTKAVPSFAVDVHLIDPSCSKATIGGSIGVIMSSVAGSVVTTSTSPSPSMSPSAGVGLRSTSPSNAKWSAPVAPSSRNIRAPFVVDASSATITTSGTSHRSIVPLPSSSVKFATSGVTVHSR